MSIELIIAILGSSVIASIITSFFAKIKNDKTERLQYITKERENWRKELRDKTVELIIDPSDNKGSKAKTYFEIRLNPYDNEDKKLLDLLTNYKNDNSQNISKAVSILLKHDWERVKQETKSGLKPYKILVILLIVSTFYMMFYDLIYNLRNYPIKDLIKEFISWKLFFFLFSLILLPYLLKILCRLANLVLDKMEKSDKSVKQYVFEFFEIPYRKPL